MSDVNGDGRPANSSESSKEEPVAVRRRLGLDGIFTGSETRRSHVSEAAATFNVVCDKLFSNNAFSFASGYVKNVLTGDQRVSDGEDRRILQSSVSATPVEQHQEDVGESSERCKRSGRDETSERKTSGTSGNSGVEASQTSDSDSGSGTEAQSLSTYFGGSTYSLIELDLANVTASEALDEERKREDRVLTFIYENMSKITQQTFRFYSVAMVPLPELAAEFVNRDFHMSCLFTDEFHKRLDVVKAYVRAVTTEAETQENRKSPIIQLHCEETASDSKNPLEDTSSDEDQRKRVSRGHIFLSYSIRRAYNSVRESRNGVVRQRKVMSKLCVLAERLVSKAEISCQLILYCLKTIVIELTQAVEAGMILEAVVGTLEGKAQNLPEFRSAASFAARWTTEALLDAERAMRLHRDASDALQAASWDLHVMKSYQPRGAQVLSNITAAGERYLDVFRQSDASLAKILNLESNMRTMRGLLTPDLVTMRRLNILINQWSAICTETLPVVLQTLSLVTQSSCNAVDVATKAVEDILIPANISLQEGSLQNGTLQ